MTGRAPTGTEDGKGQEEKEGIQLPADVVTEAGNDENKEVSCQKEKEDPLKACRESAGAKILLNGITTEMAQDDQLAFLVANFKNISFTYTMQSKGEEQVNAIVGTGKGEGDCGTVSRVMVKVAKECLLIKNIATTRKASDEGYVAPGDLTIDPNKAPNVSPEPLWMFNSHTWVIGPGGKEYDPLFGAMVDKSGWSDFVSIEKDYKPYYINKYFYKNGHVLYGRFAGDGNENYAFTDEWIEDVYQRHRGFYVAMERPAILRKVKANIEDLPEDRVEETVTILLGIKEAKGNEFSLYDEFDLFSNYDEEVNEYTYNEGMWNTWRVSNAD